MSLEHHKHHDIPELVRAIQQIIGSTQIRLSVRQIYYQLVKKNIIVNSMNEFKNFSRILLKARMYNIIDYSAVSVKTAPIVDYFKYSVPYEEYYIPLAVKEVIHQLRNASFGIDETCYQPNFHLIILEKSELEKVFDIFMPRNMNVVFLSTQNYQFFQDDLLFIMIQLKKIERVYCSYFGDYDQKSLAFEQKFKARFQKLPQFQQGAFERVAITKEQIAEYQLPDNPAKLGQVELEALPPQVLFELIRQQTKKYFDSDLAKQVSHLNEAINNRFRKRLKIALQQYLEDLK